MRRAISATLVGAALMAPAAAPATAPAATKDLWATVNVCDASKSPNRFGVRARMPGDGTHARMYMRFTAQYHVGATWKQVAGKGASQWLYAGSALFREQELGYTFSFDAPKAGTTYLMRGLVNFEWRAQHHVNGRLRTVVTRRAHALTAAGHPTTQAEPKGFTAARCQLG